MSRSFTLKGAHQLKMNYKTSHEKPLRFIALFTLINCSADNVNTKPQSQASDLVVALLKAIFIIIVWGDLKAETQFNFSLIPTLEQLTILLKAQELIMHLPFIFMSVLFINSLSAESEFLPNFYCFFVVVYLSFYDSYF
jgi:hypothetical protein